MPDLFSPPGAELNLQDAVNFRELGGYPAADGRTVRHGLLYRGGNLDGIRAPADWALIKSWGLKEILDLRSYGESVEHPDPPVPGAHAQRIGGMRLPDGDEIDFSPAGMGQLQQAKAQLEAAAGTPLQDYDMFCFLYASMPFQNPAYQELFRLLEARRAPLLFHCTCGKDRTGVAAMLILLALGASRETALRDYMLTNTYRRVFIEASLWGKPESEREQLTAVEGVNKKMGAGALDAILKRYGSYDAYFAAEFGLDKPRLAALRDYYLV